MYQQRKQSYAYIQTYIAALVCMHKYVSLKLFYIYQIKNKKHFLYTLKKIIIIKAKQQEKKSSINLSQVAL